MFIPYYVLLIRINKQFKMCVSHNVPPVPQIAAAHL